MEISEQTNSRIASAIVAAKKTIENNNSFDEGNEDVVHINFDAKGGFTGITVPVKLKPTPSETTKREDLPGQTFEP